MTRQSAASRILVIIAAACFLCLATVTGAHVHRSGTGGAVRGDCQLCTVGQAQIGFDAPLATLCGLALLGWRVVQSPAAPQWNLPATFPPPRAPPLRS